MGQMLIDAVVELALSEVGYLEKKNNDLTYIYDKTKNAGTANYTKYAYEMDTKYPTFYNGKKNGYAWCDCFVDWLMIKTIGENKAREILCQPLKSLGASCTYSSGYYKSAGRFYTKNPKVGDQIFFKNKNGDPCHTGLVVKIDSSKVYTVEGNTSNASGVIANGGGVAYKSYSLKYDKIYGYGRPKYELVEDEDPKDPIATIEYTQVDFIKDVQKILGITQTGTCSANGSTIKATVTINKSKNASHKLVTPLEKRFKQLGFYTGAIDGHYGSGMASAVNAYAKTIGGKGLDGEITAQGNIWKHLLGIL